MKSRTHTFLLSQPLCWLFLISVSVSLHGPKAHAQDIRIRVLNGRNGKAINNECVNISLGSWHGADLLVPTNRDGVALLHFGEKEVTASSACYGWPLKARWPVGANTISVMGDKYVACQEYRKIGSEERTKPDAIPGVLKEIIPTYSVKEILQSGATTANTCGKFRAKPKPGELIFFVRLRTFWERLRQ